MGFSITNLTPPYPQVIKILVQLFALSLIQTEQIVYDILYRRTLLFNHFMHAFI
jgi:hypothetical protein